MIDIRTQGIARKHFRKHHDSRALKQPPPSHPPNLALSQQSIENKTQKIAIPSSPSAAESNNEEKNNIVLEDTLGPLKSELAVTKTDTYGNSNFGAGCGAAEFRCAAHRAQHTTFNTAMVGRTPPVTPPGRCGSPGSPLSSSSGSPHHTKGLVAPTSAVDDVMEKFGRPRANSLHRRREQERRNSLPAWEEEDNEGNLSPYLDDRPRALSLFGDVSGIRFSGPMGGDDRGRSHSLPTAPNELGEDLPPAVDDWRMQGSFEDVKLHKQCKRPGCRKPPVMGVEGEVGYLCREHKRPGMVNVTGERCERGSCNLAPTYGFPDKGRQRCFSHKEPGMMHVIPATGSQSRKDKVAGDGSRPASLQAT